MRRDEQRRADELVRTMRQIVGKADMERRDLTDAEGREFDALELEVRRIRPNAEIGGTTSRNGGPTKTYRIGDRGADSFEEWRSGRHEPRPEDDHEYRSAFFSWLTTADQRQLDPEEYRALSRASGAVGAFLVPTGMGDQVVRSIRQAGPIGELARTLVTDSGETINVPANTAHGTAAWIAESGAYVPSDETFAQVPLGAYKAGTKVIVSEELLQDSAFALDAFLAAEFGERIGQLEETAYAVGDGSGKPQGIVTGGTQFAAATGNAATLTYAGWLSALFALPPQYRQNAVWIVNDLEIKNMMSLLDTQNRPLWNTNFAEGARPTFLGYPVYVSPDLAAPAASAKSVIFGDIGRAYWIRRVAGFGMQRQDELHSDNGQVGFRGFERVDGRVVLADAVRVVAHSAT